jgi:demethylmenaquinone methyltransferase/2-methoxy-6-polyprenyl-1,4-benzoquinol methylase
MGIKISRVLRPREEAALTYDRLSQWYEVLASPSEKKFIDLGLQKLQVKEEAKVLEIGFGTGYALLCLAQSVGPLGKIYGLEISFGMRNVAAKKIEKAILSDRVELTLGDAVCLPYKSNFIDSIFMSFTLELFDTPDISRVLHECLRVLRPEGRLCIIALSAQGKPSFAKKGSVRTLLFAQFPIGLSGLRSG